MENEKEYISPEFGEAYLAKMEDRLGTKLPASYPTSLLIITLVTGKCRQELIIPNNPIEEASYWLGFNPPSSYKLRDSLLVRITDRPQSFTGIMDHPEINEIIQELRRAYDGRSIERVRRNLNVPPHAWAVDMAFELHKLTAYAVYPQNGTNIASEFEAILRNHGALDDLLKNGYKVLWDVLPTAIFDNLII